MTASFSHAEIVKVIESAPKDLRPGQRAWIVGISEEKDRKGEFLKKYPSGIVYSIEFEDGSSIEVHESQLRLDK